MRLILCLLTLSLSLSATQYYVSNTGSDSANGTSTSTPWQTIAHVNAQTFSPGDSILFQSGGTWQESLIPPTSGTSGNPIVFGSYGSGAKPIIDGSNILTSWTQVSEGGTNFVSGGPPTVVSAYDLAEASGTRSDANTTDGNSLTETNGPISHSSGPTTSVGNAAHFTSASSQYLVRSDAQLTSNFPGASTWTVSDVTAGAWIKTNGTETAYHAVMGKGESNGSPSWVIYLNSSMQAAVDINTVGFSGKIAGENSSTLIQPSTWAHIVFTWNHTTGAMNLYINGVSKATANSPTMLAEASTFFTVGTGGQSMGYWDGDIAEPFVFNSLLTSTQITSIYQNGISGGANFSAYFATQSSNPAQMLEDGNRMASAGSAAALTAGQYYWDGSSKLYARGFSDDNPSGHLFEALTRTDGITLTGKSYITLSGVEVRGATFGIDGTGNLSGLALTNDTFDRNYAEGVKIVETSATINNGLVSNNSFLYNGASGFDAVITHQSGWQILNNVADHNAQVQTSRTGDYEFEAGLYVFCPGGGTGPSLISGNTSTNTGSTGIVGTSLSTQGAGIWSDTCDGVTISNNSTFHNWGPGLMIEKNTHAKLIYNVSNADDQWGIHNRDDSFSLGGIFVRAGDSTNSSDDLVANNTAYGSWVGLRVQSYDASTITNLTVENNVLYGNTGHQFYGGAASSGSGNTYAYENLGSDSQSTLAYYNGAAYSTYAALQAALGYTTHNVPGDPQLNNPGSLDFSLKSTSPARNAGVAISGYPFPYGAPDLGAIQYYAKSANTLAF